MKARKFSKKKKSSWRKNIDDTDVDNFFEEKRLQERLGGPIENKPDDELYIVDKQSKPLIRDSILSGGLTCFKPLENDSAVPDPIKKRNILRTKEQRQHPIVRRRNKERLRKGIMKKKDFKELEKYFQRRVRRLQPKKNVLLADHDLWENKHDNSKLGKVKDWLDEQTLLHTIRNTRGLKEESTYRPIPMETEVPKIDVPHPGISYKPEASAYVELAEDVARSETKMLKEEARLDRQTQKMRNVCTNEKNQENWFSEMSEGLPVSTKINDVEEEQDDSDTEYQVINPPVSREKKKTVKERKRKLRLKQEELKLQEKRDQKKKSKDICNIKKIMAEVEAAERKQISRSLKRLQKRDDKLKMARRVGRNRFEEDELRVTTTDELGSSLRELIPQGNVLRDTFLSMQKRSLIEVTKPQFAIRKSKVKTYARSTYRSENPEIKTSVLMKKSRQNKKPTDW